MRPYGVQQALRPGKQGLSTAKPKFVGFCTLRRHAVVATVGTVVLSPTFRFGSPQAQDAQCPAHDDDEHDRAYHQIG